MTAPARLLHVAFDACDADIARRLAEEGRMPHLASLLERGAVVDTVGPRGVYVGAHWTSMFTGRLPTNHEYYCWAKVDRHTYEWRDTTPRDTVGTRVWDALSGAGHRVAVIDAPHIFPTPDLDGVLVAEWGCHDRHFATQSHPPELVGQLSERFGPHPVGTSPGPGGTPAFAACDYHHRAGLHRTPGEDLALFEDLKEGIRRKTAASLHLLDQGDWSWFLTVYGESHCVGHQFWHVHDPGHPWHDPTRAELLGDPLVAVYELLDEGLGAHLERVDDDTTVYVHLTHGMGPHFDGTHMLDHILWRLDLAHRGAAPVGRRTRLAGMTIGRLPLALERRVTPHLAPLVRRRISSAPPAPNPDLDAVGRAGRTFYDVPNNSPAGGVRVNLLGRERHGRVAPGRELDRVLERLRADLLELVDVDTGEPAVLDVVRTDDVFPRQEVDDFPDLLVEWNRSSLLERVWSPTIGTVVVPYEHWRTGDHHERGLFLATGPGISPGHRDRPLLSHEVAPTVAAALGHRLGDVDGSPRDDLVPSVAARSGALASQRLARRPRPASPEPGAEVPEVEAAPGRSAIAVAGLDERVAQLERESLVWRTMHWLAAEPVPASGALVSVILATRHRPEVLPRAVRSVCAQRYPHWELVVVDNGDDGGGATRAALAELPDHRIHVVHHPEPGLSGARNVGLAAATGEIVAYLDDDNELDPEWLHAVVGAFESHPDAQVLYGARLIDDHDRVHGLPGRGWPWLQFAAYDRATLEEGMITDIGAIAHRAGLPEARFDETLTYAEDWDLLLRLTSDRPPLELPAVACRYRTDAPSRLSDEVVAEQLDRIRTRHRGTASGDA
ncbi:glycosyltransferase [Actinomarinicola tropica]|uniref:Glycosyltransferase n=1 Tax=Actinomarinicola tropica TaxID=2789776 RepID=A0A5Q2RH05_9ACTN|nr:glycosyltransferase [Actinomarinicola tropica]QGG94914.1 glycosyltransferase [Actinomarinicola tropica]